MEMEPLFTGAIRGCQIQSPTSLPAETLEGSWLSGSCTCFVSIRSPIQPGAGGGSQVASAEKGLPAGAFSLCSCHREL